MEERERIYLGRPAPAPARAEAAGDELGDDDLDQVAGGLARVWVEPGAASPASGVSAA